MMHSSQIAKSARMERKARLAKKREEAKLKEESKHANSKTVRAAKVEHRVRAKSAKTVDHSKDIARSGSAPIPPLIARCKHCLEHKAEIIAASPYMSKVHGGKDITKMSAEEIAALSDKHAKFQA